MALRVAHCPRCKSPIVFGERACRGCGQTFDYGPNGPPIPTPQQIAEALAAAAFGPPPTTDPSIRARSSTSGEGRAAPPAPPAPPAPLATSPRLEGLDDGRFAAPPSVGVQDVPGLIDSRLFAAFTPEHVDVRPLDGIEHIERDVSSPAVQALAAVEHTQDQRVGDVAAGPPVAGLFGSDLFRTGDVAVRALDGLEVNPSAARPEHRGDTPPAADKAGARRTKKPDDAHALVSCRRCGEKHRLPRCPSCGTAHPDIE